VRVLFDQGTPVPLRGFRSRHEVSTVYERGWSRLRNGELLDRAEQEAFAVLVTTDSNLKYQQNLESRSIAIIALSSTSWLRIRQVVDRVVRAVDQAGETRYTEVQIP
jgi:hypothetical protein